MTATVLTPDEHSGERFNRSSHTHPSDGPAHAAETADIQKGS